MWVEGIRGTMVPVDVDSHVALITLTVTVTHVLTKLCRELLPPYIKRVESVVISKVSLRVSKSTGNYSLG